MREPVGGGKTGKLICIYIYYIYKEEGAVREPVGGGSRGSSWQIERYSYLIVKLHLCWLMLVLN